MATLTSRLILSLTDRVSGPARGIGGALDSLQRRAARTSGVLLGTGGIFSGGAALRNLMAVGAGYVGVTRGMGGTVGAAIKFEEAFADVRKVFNGTPGELQEIRHQILEMSKVLPNSADGLSSIFAAAAQSNIPTQELGKFSEMVAKVAVAWDVTEGETSESLAKIKNQLGLDVRQIGLYADAINHLGNNTAASAPDLVDFSRRVAANGEMFGFSATQTLAFGGAMVAMGAQTEVASTSFRNMGRALTIGERATKSHRIAFSKLGIDAVKTAKDMQKDALGTTLSVIDRIAGLPEWQRISIASALFGDEARALMPVISNSKELRRQIALVANETDYAGSSFEEYEVRAGTFGNTLKIMGNQFRAIGIGIGDGWLPTLKQLGLGIGDVLTTLDKRIGVLDKVQVAFSSFMTGLGGTEGAGGIRQLMNDLGDMLFGEAFTGEMGAADERAIGLAKLSNTFRDIGRDLRSFSEDIRAGDIGGAMGHVGDALQKMSGSMTVGGAIAIGLTGRALLGLSFGIASLALSKTGRLIMAAYAIATLIDATKGAESIGEFTNELGKLSTFDWFVVAGGVGLLATQVFRLGRGMASVGRSVAKVFGGGKTPAPPAKPAGPTQPAPATGGKTPPSGSTGKGPWSPKSPAAPVTPRGPTGTPVSRPPVPSPMMEFPAGASAPTGWGAALKSFFGKGGLIGTGLMWVGESLIDTGLDAVNRRLYTPEQRARADEARGDGSTFSMLRALDGELARLFPALRVQQQGEPQTGGLAGASGASPRAAESRSMLDLGRSMDEIRDLLDGRDAVQPVELLGVATVETRPTGTQDVRVTNPQPAPVINITVNATTNANPAEIASMTAANVSRELNALSNGAYSDGAN